MQDGMTSEQMHSSRFGVFFNLNVGLRTRLTQFKIISPEFHVQSKQPCRIGAYRQKHEHLSSFVSIVFRIIW